jgi:4-amino-4-deoxy-L-arabinose transferase-like glycosyltransferase
MEEAEPTPTAGWKGSLFGPIGLVVALAVGLRAIVSISEEIIFGDGPEFVRIAEALARGDLREALGHQFHPLTSAAMALVHVVAGVSLEGAGRIVSVLAGGAATAALYGLAHAGWGPKAALVAALLFAVHPRMIAVSSSVQSDGLHLALFLSAALATWGALSRQSARAALAAGLLCGLAYLTRPEGMAVCAVFGVGLGALLLSRRVQATRAFALGCAFSVAVLAVSGPYLVALRESSGSWTLTQKKSVAGILQVDRLASPAPVSPEDPTGTSRPHPAPQRRQPARLAKGGGVGAAVGEVVHDGIRALDPIFLALVLLGVRLRQPSAHTLYVLAYAGLFT